MPKAVRLADLLVKNMGDKSREPENVAAIKAVAARPLAGSLSPSAMSR